MHIADERPSSSSSLRPQPTGHSVGSVFNTVGASMVAMFESLVSGAIAGATAKTVIAPGDRVKIIYQVDPSRPFTLRNAMRTGSKIVEHGGVLGLWRGNGATMMRVVPAASITFMSFERYQSFFDYLFRYLLTPGSESTPLTPGVSALVRFCAGSLAGVTSTTLTYPLDMLRARYAAHSDPIHPKYPSYMQGVREIWQVEGLRGLYGGLRPTLVGIVPYAGINFMVFGTFKSYIIHVQGFRSEKEIPTHQRLVAGALSGLIAQSSTYPLDIVRRRMQVSTAKYARHGISGTLSIIYRTEGMNGLFKGLTMNWVKGPVATAVTFTVNDLVKGRIRDYNKNASHYEVQADGAISRDDGSPVRPAVFHERLMCGAVAGGLAKLWTAPFDRIKIMYNVGLQTCEERAGWRQVHRQVLEMMRESRGSMWQGSGAMMVRVVPYAGITYSAYEPLKHVGRRVTYSCDDSFASNFIAGALSASIATVLLHPFDLLRVRNATHAEGPRYLSHRSGLLQMVAQGGMRSLFEGVGPSLLGIAPMAGTAFAVYESLKHWYADKDTRAVAALTSGDDVGLAIAKARGPLPFWKLWVMGCVAGCIAGTASYPLNIVRRKAMVEQVVLGGVIANLRDMYTSKGFYAGLYGRLPLGWVMGMMTVGFSFSINDQLLYWALLARAQLHSNLGDWTSQPLWYALQPLDQGLASAVGAAAGVACDAADDDVDADICRQNIVR